MLEISSFLKVIDLVKLICFNYKEFSSVGWFKILSPDIYLNFPS